MQYEQMCNEILAAVGGKENVSDCYNCMTRLRLNLIDQSKADLDALKKVKGVMGVNVAGGQTQCIIGQSVSKVYAEFCEIGGFQKNAAITEDLDSDKPKEKLSVSGVFNNMINAISGCIQPLLPIIIAGSMFKLLCSLIGPSIFNIVSTESNLYVILNMAGDAPFYFLPLLIGYTGGKYFKANIPLTMVMGAFLLHPTLVDIVNAGNPFDVFGIPMTLANYSSSVVPMILCAWALSKVERFFQRVIPDMLKMMLVDLLTLLVMLPVGLCLLAPLGTIIGNWLALFITFVSNAFGPFGVAIVCTIYPLLIITGMHLPALMGVTAPVFFGTGHEGCLLVADTIDHFSVMGICLAYAIRSKKKENRSLGISSFISIFLGGVVEPCLFGIELPHKKLLVTQLLATGLGGLVAALLGVSVYTLTSGNILNVLAFMGSTKANMIGGVVAVVVGFAAAFVGGLVLGFEED